MTGFRQDLRHALRSLLRAPGFSLVAVLTLTLGLGLGTAAFSLIDGVLLRPLPYPAADRLLLLKATVPPEGRDTVEITYADAHDIASGTDVFDGLAALIPYAGTTTITDPPSRIEGFEVSPTLFTTLGVEPALGRAFTARDGEAGSPPVVMISHGLWQRLGSPRDIVGRPLPINEVPRTIVGVAPPGFRIELLPGAADIFVPLTPNHPFAANRGMRAFRVIARLRGGLSTEQATAAVATVGSRLARAFPDTNRGRTFSAHHLQDEMVSDVRVQLWLIAGLVALVLLVAAINLAGLLLTRTVGRIREVAVRLALGAGQWRIARESIAEGLVMTSVGAASGAFLAGAALDLIRATPGIAVPRLAEIAIDYRALGALAIASLVIACGVGLVPLLLVQHLRGTGSLRTGHQTPARAAVSLRSTLIVGQSSFAFVLLAAAALLATSLHAVLRQPLGFETTDVITMRITVPESRYPQRDDTVRFYTDLLDDLRADPSVRSAGVVSTLPLAGNTGSTLSIQGRDDVPLAMRPTVGWHWTSPGYFSSIGMPILQGRDFAAADVTRAPHVTVINETLARLYFPGESPIGRRVYFGGFGPGGPPEWHEVIGVVGDVRHRRLDAEPDARAYDLFGQHWGRTVSLAVRTTESPMQTANLVRELLASRDPRLAVFAIRTTADLVSAAVAMRRLLFWLVLVFAIVGLALAVIGLYGTVSYMVVERTREVGVRLALGATGAQIQRMVMAGGLRLVATGLGLGLVVTFALRKAIETQLFGVTAMNIPALAIAATALIVAAALACLAPAWRAMGINPVDALRSE
jgi:predicted permease